MSLLREIQEALLQPSCEIHPILLKLRLLAARLGSEVLEEWVRYKTEGYPAEAEVPDYRKFDVSYSGTFSGPFGSGIQNAPIPPFLIEKFAGKQWTAYKCRQSIATIDNLIAGDDGSGTFSIEASNLMLLLQGKVYKDYACNSVVGRISKSTLAGLQSAVRTKILELTIQLEKTVPAAAEISLKPAAGWPDQKEQDTINQITYQVVNGNLTQISNNVQGNRLSLNIEVGDIDSIIRSLISAGIPSADASEFAELVSSECGESKDQPFGAKAKAWIARNAPKALNGTWKMGIDVATKLLTEAALKFYGFR